VSNSKQFNTQHAHVSLPGNNGTIVWPFSPPIYQTEITHEQRQLMLEHASLSEQKFNANLAGNMIKGDSFQLQSEHIEYWEPVLLEKVNMFMAGMKLCQGADFDPTVMLNIPTPDSKGDRNTHRKGRLVLESLWVNYQREGDYNPPHTHTGALSMVIFLDVPKHIFDLQAESNTQNAGNLVFYNGERISPWQHNSWPVQPYDNLMFVFPSLLRHSVPPFYTQGCRVSVSGNWVVA
jgi:hypothetical protein